jgi:hypothetical protein
MKRHSIDVVSLVFGALFIAIAGWWLLSRYIDVNWNVPNLGWIAAGALILLGLLGVVASVRGGDRPAAVTDSGDEPHHEPDPDEPVLTTTESEDTR